MPARIALLIVMTTCCAWGQFPGYSPVSDAEAFKRAFTAHSDGITTITAEFMQEKSISALTEKVLSKGTFTYKKSGKVRIEYFEPYDHLMIMNGDRVLLRDGDRQNRMNMKSNKLLRQVNSIIVECIQGSALTSGEFMSGVWEDKESYLVRLEPVAKSLKEFFVDIILVIEKEDYLARSIIMREPGGDTTTMIFTGKKINEPVPDSMFAL